MSTRYAVSLNDPINLHVLYASTPFEAVRQAQISTGSLDRYPPGRYTFRVTPGLRLVPECEVLEDPCGGDCECERLLRGSADDIDVPVVLNRDAAVGCGASIALGALHALGMVGTKRTAPNKLRSALAASESFSAGVRAPFYVTSLPLENPTI